MEFEENYVEYVAIFSLSILTAAASYFVDPGKPLTYLALLFVPATFGYTAYISSEGFRKSSVSSLIALFFVSLNYITAIAALTISLGTPLVSAFAGGKHFRDFFRTVSIPLLVVGLVVGSVAFYKADQDPAIKQEIRNSVADAAGSHIEAFNKRSNLIGEYKNAQVELIESTSSASVQASELYVLNQTRNELNAQQMKAIQSAFKSAETDIPTRIANRSSQQLNNTAVDISSRISDAVKDNLTGKMFLAIVPAAGFAFYSINPVVGLLTALAAVAFRAIDRRMRSSGSS